MKISAEKEHNVQHLISGAVAGIIIILGLMVNGFIVAVNVTDWIKGRPVTATDPILTSLGITRMIYQSVSLFNLFSYMFSLETIIIYDIIVEGIWDIFFSACIWLSALLSVVFCLKISNLDNVLFLRLKNIILQRVIRLIIASLLGSISYTLLCYLVTNIALPKTSSNETYSESNKIKLYMFLVWNILPLLIYFTSSVLLISSLCHHMYVMRFDRSVTGQLDAYYKTIKFLSFSSFSYAFFFCIIVAAWCYDQSFDILGDFCIFNSFPTIHSIYLIYVTTKFRTRFSGIIQHGLNYLITWKHS